MAKIGKTRHSKIDAKRLQISSLILLVFTNIVLLMMLVPVEIVSSACSRAEVRLSLLRGHDRRLMEQVRIRANDARIKNTPEIERPYGIAEGVSACSGETYKLFIIQ